VVKIAKQRRAKRNGGFATLIGIIFLASVLGFSSQDNTVTIDNCSDGIDNDGDGNTDTNDPECNSSPGNTYYDGNENDPQDGQGPPAP